MLTRRSIDHGLKRWYQKMNTHFGTCSAFVLPKHHGVYVNTELFGIWKGFCTSSGDEGNCSPCLPSLEPPLLFLPLPISLISILHMMSFHSLSAPISSFFCLCPTAFSCLSFSFRYVVHVFVHVYNIPERYTLATAPGQILF